MGIFDFFNKTGQTPPLNPEQPGFYDPTEEERKRARKMALIQAGAGMLMNNRGNYGEFAPAAGAGLAAGIQGYQQGLQEGPERRMKQLQQQLYAQQVGSQVQRAKADSVDDDVAMGVFRNVFQEAGYDPETGGFMQVSNTPQPIRSSPLPYVGEGEIPLMSEDLSYKPAPPPNPMDSIIDELGWTPGRKKYFMAQYKADPKGAMKSLERSYLELDRASRKGRVEARDVLAKEKAIQDEIDRGTPLGKRLLAKQERSGVNVTVPVSYGSFTSAVDAQGNPVFIQPSKSGGAPNVVQGFMPSDDAAKAQQAQTAAAARTSSLDRLESDIESLLNQPGLEYAVGLYSAAPVIPGTAQADAVAAIESLASRAAVAALNDMRELSKTGGAVGQVTEKEWPKLEAQLANLNRKQSLPSFKKELTKFRDLVRNTKRLINEAQSRKPFASQPKQAQPASPSGWKIEKVK